MSINFKIDDLTTQLNSLMAEFPELEDDEQLRADVLEGETDIAEVMERIWSVECEAKGFIAGIAERQKDMAERKSRYAHKVEAMRRLMLLVLNRADLSKLELPEFTVSTRKVPPAVVIDDPTSVPFEFGSSKWAPDKKLIKTALEGGETVEGCHMSNGSISITVRAK
jgi:hypothetical protein